MARVKRLVTAFAEPAAGPGWANTPLYIIWRDEKGALHEECLQPEDQSITMKALYAVASASHASLCHQIIRSYPGEYTE